MKTQESVKQLMRFPLHIVQKITRSSSRDKSGLVADLAIRLEGHGITFEQSPIADSGIVVKAFGKQIARIDATRGKQEFKLVDDVEWSTEWAMMSFEFVAMADTVKDEKPFGDDEPTPADRANAIVEKYFAKADERKPLTQQEADELVERAQASDFTVIEIPGALTDEYALIDDESGIADIIESHFVNTQQSRLTVRTVSADQAYEWAGDKAQDEYEDSTDESMTDAQRLLIQAHGYTGERLLAKLDERFEVEIVENRLEITDTTTNRAVLVEYNREAGTWMGYQSNGQLWAVTGKPSHHLELITKGFI